MKNIFQIKEHYIDILRVIYEAEGEITPEIENELNITESEFQEKAINYAYIIKKLETDNLVIEAEIKRLKVIKDKNAAIIEKLEGRVVDAMKLFGADKVESPLVKLSLRKSESVNISDESRLSDNFFTTKITKTVSKTALKDAIKSGADISGAELVTNFNLQIK
tara:strand:+ start:719 stop:1210 length:492 start_codon:yes stop_codon:yes gene_type:complete